MPPQVFVIALDPNPDGPRLARAFLCRVLSQCHQQRHAGTASVLVSELVTNAVIHAQSTMQVKVAILDDLALRVEVTDASSAPPRRLQPVALATAGRGLNLVDALADQWAYQLEPSGGKTVWFQLNTE